MKKDRGINELIEKYTNLSQEQIEKLMIVLQLLGKSSYY